VLVLALGVPVLLIVDLPWIELTSASGQIRYHHDGWLPEATLARLAG
jgi:hypothetical protein